MIVSANFIVVEVVLNDSSDLEALRKWMAENTRGGDGLVAERGRLFVVFPQLHEEGLRLAIKRLKGKVEKMGASLEVCTPGQDELADSVQRRAEAQIVPVQPRQETS